MQRRQGKVLMSLRSAQQFLESNRERLSSVYASGARIRLDEIIAELEDELATQAYSYYAAAGETKRYYALRIALQRDHMAPLAKVAAGVLTDAPELAPLRLPLKRLTAERLAAYARGMATAAAPHKEDFVAAGLVDDFLERIAEAVDAMVESLDRRKQIRATSTEATHAIWRLSALGRKVVHMLDAFVQSAIHDEPALLTGWNAAKRVELTGTRSARRTSTEESPDRAAAKASDVPDTAGLPAALAEAREQRPATFPQRLLATAERAPRLFPSLLRAFRRVSESHPVRADADTKDAGDPRSLWRDE